MTLRSTIADAFGASGLTERELAKATGLNTRTVHRILTEDGLFIDALTLRYIAEALGLDYNTLIALRPEFPENPKLLSTSRAEISGREKQEMLSFLRKNLEKRESEEV